MATTGLYKCSVCNIEKTWTLQAWTDHEKECRNKQKAAAKEAEKAEAKKRQEAAEAAEANRKLAAKKAKKKYRGG